LVKKGTEVRRDTLFVPKTLQTISSVEN